MLSPILVANNSLLKAITKINEVTKADCTDTGPNPDQQFLLDKLIGLGVDPWLTLNDVDITPTNYDDLRLFSIRPERVLVLLGWVDVLEKWLKLPTAPIDRIINKEGKHEDASSLLELALINKNEKLF